jgi:TRAP-type C4-dicarboxylate transport system substrate-binding protein
MLDALETHLIAGAFVSLGALSTIHADAFVLELPGATRTWSDLDRVRAAVEPDVVRQLSRTGLHLGWWEDTGLAHLFTQGFVARRPVDLTGKRLSTWASDPQDPVLSELASTLRSPLIQQPSASQRQAFFGTATDASTLPLDHLDDTVAWCGTAGAMLFDEQTLAALPHDLAIVFQETSVMASHALATTVRNHDATALAQLAHRMTHVTHTPAETREWDDMYSRVIRRLANQKLDKATVNRVLAVRGLQPVP